MQYNREDIVGICASFLWTDLFFSFSHSSRLLWIKTGQVLMHPSFLCTFTGMLAMWLAGGVMPMLRPCTPIGKTNHYLSPNKWRLRWHETNGLRPESLMTWFIEAISQTDLPTALEAQPCWEIYWTVNRGFEAVSPTGDGKARRKSSWSCRVFQTLNIWRQDALVKATSCDVDRLDGLEYWRDLG